MPRIQEKIHVSVQAPHYRGQGVLKSTIAGYCIVEMPNGVFISAREIEVNRITNPTN